MKALLLALTLCLFQLPGIGNAVTVQADSTAWAPEQFTNPKNHNAKKFRYSVHMINLATGKKTVSEVYDSIVSEKSSRELLSYSVIQHDWIKTFAHIGFIIEVPPQNILAANKDDMGTFNHDNIARWVELNNGIPTPDELIAQGKASDGYYNEVIAKASGPNGERIRIVGVISTMPKGIPDELIEEAVVLAEQLKLPVIYTDKRDFSKRK